MATVWAKRAGNWTDTTLWAFWNESTQQIEDYGQVPQNGDVVYANGYTVTLNMNNVSVSRISNEDVIYTQRSGGYFNVSNSQFAANVAFVLNADIYSKYKEYVLYINRPDSNLRRYNIINGTIRGTVKNIYCAITINGNLNGGNFESYSQGAGGTAISLVINGNVILETPLIWRSGGFSSQYASLEINGSINSQTYPIVQWKDNTATNNTYCDTATFNGNVSSAYSIDCPLPSIRNIAYLNGTYSNSYSYMLSNSIPKLRIGNLAQLELLNYDGYPIILSAYQIQDDYPPADKVVNGTIYDFGRKAGTYQPEFPQEAVVLKDVTYDNGNKTGTLETSNISQQLISRLENCATVETVQQLLVAHLDN